MGKALLTTISGCCRLALHILLLGPRYMVPFPGIARIGRKNCREACFAYDSCNPLPPPSIQLRGNRWRQWRLRRRNHIIIIIIFFFFFFF